jgi:hypothetical protein
MMMELLPSDLKYQFGRYIRDRFPWFSAIKTMPPKGSRRALQLIEAAQDWWVQLSENDLYRALLQMEHNPKSTAEGIANLRSIWQRVRACPLPPDLARDYTRYIDTHLWWFGQGPPPRPGSARDRQLAAAIQEWFAGLSPEDQQRVNDHGQQQEG